MTYQISGETSLSKLLSSLTLHLAPETYVFVTLDSTTPLPPTLAPRMVFRESEGTTLIVERDEASEHGWKGVYACRMITCTVHSSLEAVGFMATMTARLAARGISVNAVSGYYHDHLFVTEGRADEAVQMLDELAAESRRFGA